MIYLSLFATPIGSLRLYFLGIMTPDVVLALFIHVGAILCSLGLIINPEHGCRQCGNQPSDHESGRIRLISSRRDGQREAPGEGNIARGTMEPCHDLHFSRKG